MARSQATHRMSINEDELKELTYILSQEVSQPLSKHAQSLLGKCKMLETKISYGMKQPDYVKTNERMSTVAKLGQDEESYLLEHGTPQEKDAIEAALAHTIATGQVANWKDFLVIQELESNAVDVSQL